MFSFHILIAQWAMEVKCLFISLEVDIYKYIYTYILNNIEGYVKQPKYLWELKICFFI